MPTKELSANVLVSLLVARKENVGSEFYEVSAIDDGLFSGKEKRIYMFGVNNWTKIVPARLFVSSGSGDTLEEFSAPHSEGDFPKGLHDSFDEYLRETFSEKLYDVFESFGFDPDDELDNFTVETLIDSFFDPDGSISVPKKNILVGWGGQLVLGEREKKKLTKRGKPNILAAFCRSLDATDEMQKIEVAYEKPIDAVKRFRAKDTFFAEKYQMIGIVVS